MTAFVLNLAVAVVLTLVSQLTWVGPWSWWAPMLAGLALTLYFARVPHRQPLLSERE